ncbi:MAG: RHS repeat-associated core domain-containing protein [Terriglobia bacterium]
MTRVCANCGLAVAVLCLPLLLEAQSEISPFDGYTPGEVMSGAPAGSQALSGFENYNPASGVMTINIPLLTVKGRGSVSVPITVPLNRNLWTVTNVSNGPGPQDYDSIFSSAGWDPLPYRFGAGRMLFRSSGDYCSGQSWNQVLTRGTYVSPDGTETEFIDQATGGTPEPGSSGYNRGTVFMADNGSFAKFTSSVAISDSTTCDSMVTPATGTLVFRDGTKYTITDGYVTAITDRNGNTTTLSVNSIVDSMGRTYSFASGTNSAGRNYETVQYPDSNGDTQTITIWYSPLDQVLVGSESIWTYAQLWSDACGPDCYQGGNSDQLYDPNDRISEIDLADGSKYTFIYHSDGDVEQITLPTGGVLQYDYQEYIQQQGMLLIALQLFERREYLQGALVSRTDFLNSVNDPLYPLSPPFVLISYYDGTGTTWGTGNLLSKMEIDVGSTGTGPTSGTNYNPPQYDQTSGIIYYARDSTSYAQKGTTVLTSKTLSFANGSCKVNCSTPQEVITTVGSMTKDSDYTYDQYNNQTDEKDYDWGSGSHGNLLRDTQTTYSTSYIAQNILNLPAQRTVYDGSGALAAQSLFSYDPNGNLTQQQQLIASGQYATTKYTYDANGDLTSVTDPDNHTTSFAYSPSSAPPVSVTNAKSQTTSIGYNGLDQPVSVTDLNGAVTSFMYNDPLSRLTEISFANGGHTYYSYPGPTQAVTQQDQNKPGDAALKSQALYDGFGRPIENDTFENASQYIATTTQYDPLGHVSVKTNPSRPGDGLNYPTTYSYDALGRLIQVKTADGATVTTSYSGNQTTVTDQARNAKTMTHDALGRLTNVVDATGTTYYTYNALGKLTKVTQGSQTRTFSYDMLGRLTQAANPESGTVTYAYDAAGNLISRTDARGVTTTYSYDALNRLINKTYSDGTPAVTYIYDSGTNGKGHLTGYSNQISVTGLTYDAVGHVVSSDQVTTPYEYDFSYAYNVAGALTSETYPSGRVVSTTYDGAGRPVTVAGKLNGQTTNYVTTAAYYPSGALYYYQDGNGMIPTWSYNNQLQMSAYWADLDYDPNRYLFYSAYNWGTTNDNGNLLGETDYEGGPGALNTLTQFSRTYAYDGVNRLTSASDSGGWTRSFKYDQYGNMWVDPNGSSGVGLGNTPTANVYNPGNNQVYGASYDAAGNELVVNLDTLAYDANNLVKSATEPPGLGGATETYLYDGAGRRVMKFGPSGKTTYVYDAFGQLAAEYSSVPDTSPCQTCYLSYDQRGDVRMVTDASGNIVARHDYLPFGAEVPGGMAGRGTQWGLTNDVEQKFTGQIRDQETGMDYFHARYYGSAFGRFTSPDPANAGANPLDPQSWNAYAYVGNDPLTVTDPSGTNWFTGFFSDIWNGMQDAATAIGSWFIPGCPPRTFCVSGYGAPYNDLNLIMSGGGSGGYSSSSGGGGGGGSAPIQPAPPAQPPAPPAQPPAPPATNPPPTTSSAPPKSGTQTCVAPNLLQRAGIAVQGTIARFLNKTIGIGAGGSIGGGAIVGVSLSVSRQVVVAPNGQAAFATSLSTFTGHIFNSVTTPSYGGYGGIQFSISNAGNVNDLDGSALDYGFGGGRGWGGGLDLSTDLQTSQATLTLGGGFGGYGHGLTNVTTSITPICGN